MSEPVILKGFLILWKKNLQKALWNSRMAGHYALGNDTAVEPGGLFWSTRQGK